MANDVVLTSALRSNLLSLQRTQSSIDSVQNILATGLKVSSALDGPQSFFAAQALNNRASDLTRLLDGIGQSIQTIKAADAGTKGLTSLIDQADSIINSAREAITTGESIAKVVGNVDLSDVSDITALTGISNQDTLVFGYIDKDGTTLRERTVTLSTGDSIEEVLAKINDIGGTASSTVYGEGEVVTATLDADGQLQIKSKVGSFRLEFEAGTADVTDTTDINLGTALGFGDIARTVQSGNSATSANFEVTALASAKLTSGAFYEAGGTAQGFADASTLLSAVDRADDTARFTFGGENEADLVIQVNGSTEITISNSSLSGITIQGLVDLINNNDLLSASYDDTTGQLSIEATDSSVRSIQVEVSSPATTTTADVLDFDFGIKASLSIATGAAAQAAGENYYLASAADELEALQSDYDTVLSQIDDLVADSGYRGTNLLNGDTLETFFNEDRTNKLTTTGATLTSGGLGITAANFSSVANIESSADQVLAAKSTVRNFGSRISNSLTIIQTREEFTEDLINTLNEGADKLTLADQNEEGAKLLSLQTRQQLGVTTLSLASQAQQSILRLF